jgi:hypothetical protein
VAVFVLADDVTERIVREPEQKRLLKPEQFTSLLHLKIQNAPKLARDRNKRDTIVEMALISDS